MHSISIKKYFLYRFNLKTSSVSLKSKSWITIVDGDNQKMEMFAGKAGKEMKNNGDPIYQNINTGT
jgi:hypothetical protein